MRDRAREAFRLLSSLVIISLSDLFLPVIGSSIRYRLINIMRIFQNTLVSLLITASIIIAGITIFFLSVQGRPEAPADLVAQADAAQANALAAQEQQGTPAADPAPAQSVTVVEGVTIVLDPLVGEIVQRSDTLPIVPQIEPSPTPETVVVDPIPQGDGQVPTATPAPAVPLPTVTPFPTIVQQPVPVGAADFQAQSIIFANHVVVAGETLYSIARLYNSAVELMAARGISSTNLQPGATISVPYPNPAFCPNMTGYVVREKDTVFRIASVNGVTVESIRNANALDENYSIDVAQVLCIP